MSSRERLHQKRQLAAWLKQDDHPCDRLRLALLLSTPLGSLEDKRRAVKLLEQVMADDTMEPPEQRLAGLLRDQLRQQIWALVRIARLKRETKKSQQAANKLKQEKAHLESLLEQLKTIERNFNEQEQAIITPATPPPTHGKGKAPAGRR
jgi:small-conductance mechanosensitive channel